MSAGEQFKVLIVIFPGFNTLDMNGPYEVLRKTKQGNAFKVTVASETEITTSTEGVHIKRDVLLDDQLIAKLEDFDILIVPGGTLQHVRQQCSESDGKFMELILSYSRLAARKEDRTRILLSICTGALFLGQLGIFNGRVCTTHWAAYGDLKARLKIASETSPESKSGTVVAARFADSGLNSHGVRIISSGGVSCGIDACLWVVRLRCGETEAKTVADSLDYAWRKTEGVVVLDAELEVEKHPDNV
ncbi:hypothetical protein OQA88_7085 [Cercophora sp. LCS_1]